MRTSSGALAKHMAGGVLQESPVQGCDCSFCERARTALGSVANELGAIAGMMDKSATFSTGEDVAAANKATYDNAMQAAKESARKYAVEQQAKAAENIFSRPSLMSIESKAMLAADRDRLLIHEAAVLAGTIAPGKNLPQNLYETYAMFLAEMRSRTERARLAHHIKRYNAAGR